MKSLILILLLLAGDFCFANKIRVGSGQPFKTLKEGIANAGHGDTVMLYRGVYREEKLLITKSICLLGVQYPVLDGEGKNEILLISGSNIVVRGIHFANAGYSSTNDYAAVKLIDAAKVIVADNKINNSSFAIHISNSNDCIIRNNIITGTNKTEHLSGNGIHLWKSSRMTIENNRVYNHRDGIYFEFVTNSIIRNNLSERNIRYGLHFMFSNDDAYLDNTFKNNGAGVAVMYSKKVTMIRNHFEENWGPSSYGILLKDISDSRIESNIFYRNTVGIHMEGSSRIDMQKNIFRENGWAIKVQSSCDDNNFHYNDFYRNSFDLATNGSMNLNRFYNNYWDKYDGYDMNRDGTGDVPYHPVSMYSMIIEQNPHALMLFRSFTMQLLDKAEKAIPSLTPEELVDNSPRMKSMKQ